jgi:hypothetical protein
VSEVVVWGGGGKVGKLVAQSQPPHVPRHVPSRSLCEEFTLWLTLPRDRIPSGSEPEGRRARTPNTAMTMASRPPAPTTEETISTCETDTRKAQVHTHSAGNTGRVLTHALKNTPYVHTERVPNGPDGEHKKHQRLTKAAKGT